MMIRHLIMAFGAFAISYSAIAADAPYEPVSETELRSTIAVLASDEFEGREPGTSGETKTLAYIAKAFWEAGLSGGTKSHGWYQPVALTQIVPGAGTLSFSKDGKNLSIPNDDVLVTAGGDSVVLNDLPVVFVGYGVNGDGKAIGNVEGAIAVVIATAPPYSSQQSFTSRKNALYDAGAKAVIGVFGASSAFGQVRQYFLNDATRLSSEVGDSGNVQGGISAEYAGLLLQAAGINPEPLIEEARSASFAGKLLGLTANVQTRAAKRPYTSYNLIAKIPGTNPQAGAVMYTGHWDHLGICGAEGAEDRICNGAVDNASGIAVMIATAQRLKRMGPFERDIYFVATTAEELGLLGAYALAENPPVPLRDIVINMNVDTIAIADRGAKVAIIGRGRTALEPEIERIARSLGREVEEGDAANAFIQRQDGWALLQQGVPAVMVGGSFADLALLQKFLAGDYHGVGDELNDALPLGGAAEDADLHIALGAYFADTDLFRPKSNE